MTSPDFSTPLVDLSEVKDHLNIPSTDTSQDAELQGFIEAASVYIQNITGPITPQQLTETHSGGGTTICLFHPPVLSVTSVVEYNASTGYTLNQATLGTDAGAYAYTLDDPKSGVIRRRYSGNLVGRFIGGDHNVVVTYMAGQATIPPDIRMAVLQDIAGIYQPSQLGPSNSMFPNPGQGNLNPISMFPRVAEVLSAVSMRVPAIG